MPRIDPLQLLKCLSVLLSPDGGILSRDEVPRLVNLMTKFSKKLVSKSIYVLILKNTDTSLVDMFMAEGGWALIQTWIQDAVLLNNWVLVREILELLLITPVDVERLKMNCLPKLIKSLSRRDDLDGVAQLSDQIVQKWLTIVKGTAPSASVIHPHAEVAPQPQPAPTVKVELSEPTVVDTIKQEPVKPVTDENAGSIKVTTFYKATSKESKPTDKDPLDTGSTSSEAPPVTEKVINDQVEAEKTKKADAKREKLSKSSDSKSLKSDSSSPSKRDKEKDRRRSSHSSSKSKSSRDKDRKDKDKSEKDKERIDKDKNKDRKDKDKSRDKDKDKHSSSKSSSRSSSSHSKDSKGKSRDKDRSKDKERDKDRSKDSKETQAEKDKDTLAKIKPPTIDKLGRIPKKSSSSNSAEEKEKSNDDRDIKKKPAFSILDKKKEGEERAKTVKVFNSKMRSTGLEEEVKPPPPRNALKKPTPSVQLPTIPQKRPSPIRDIPSSIPPEKKIKIDKVDVPERPGAIKLIPPKPKPMLQESDMFMDALSASVTKKPAKRKRRASQSKETPSSPTSSPAVATETMTPTSPTSTLASPTMKNIAPINFYQDTLTEESEPNSEESKQDEKENNDAPSQENNTDTPASPSTAVNQVEAEEEEVPSKIPRLNEQGLRGVLLYSKKKGPKRSIQWKAEEDLVEVRYFELDETERVNVTKTFTDMAKMEMSSEREALLTCRKPAFDDTMEPQIMWRLPILCEQPEPSAVPGSKSLEKDIQFAREKSVLQALYFDKRRIPDSPEEPIPENHQMSDPVMIPLDDPEGQINDLRTTPWPEPKGMQIIEQPQLPPVFNQNMSFNANYMGPVPPQFGGLPPRFGPPGGPQMPPMPPGNFGHPAMGPPNMMPPPEMINPGYMPGPHDGYPGPEGYPPGAPPFIGPPNIGPPNMNMYGPPSGNYNNYRGPQRGGGNFRRGGGNNQQGGGWVRMSAPNNNWKRGSGGSGGSKGRGPNNRVCKNITNHGYCRNGDNCQWFHPQ